MPTPEDFTDSPPMPASPAPASVVRPLPLTDHEVQLWDVDVTPMHAGSDASDEAAPRIPDQLDDVLVATLMERRWQVIPGNTVTLPVTVLNNSTHRLTVRAHLEGWLDDRWLVDPYVQTTIPPGERRILELTVAPPRQPQAEAGDYQVAVVVRALETMAHLVRIGLVLTLLPFDRVQLELADAAAPSAAWWRRRLLLPLQIVNAGNHPLVLHLEGATSPRLGAIAFGGSEVAARSTVELRPGQRVRVPVQLTVKRLPLLALHSRVLPFVVTAQDATGKALEQVRGAIAVRPIIGAWQMASFAGVAGAGVAAVSLLLLAGVLFLRAGTTASPVASSPPPVPAVIIVTLNQPVAAPSAPIVVTPSLATALQSQPDPALPLVLPDQVTAPGSGGPARVLAPVEAAPITAAPITAAPVTAAPITAAPTSAMTNATTARGAPMTYAQMFQAVGAQYDLDWRMLAAQAYIESSFDALALSQAGAMGLMQVLPTTWREWAPAVGASDPFDSYSNVQVAAIYLDYLRTQLAQQGHPEKEWMLVAYNWGLDRVSDFLANGGGWQDLPDARRKYAEDILRVAQTLP